MNQFRKRTRTFYQYAAMYFVVLILLSGIAMFSMLRFSADKLVSLETKNAQNTMRRAADILDKQIQTMQAIAVQINAHSRYHPSNIHSGPLYDMDLLEDFKQYSNYSPLTKQNFLIYSDTDKIYTSAGNTSYFGYYTQDSMGIPDEITDEMLVRILQAKNNYFERYASNLIMVFPLRSFAGGQAQNAAMCFVLSDAQIRDYLSQMTVGMPENYEIRMDGQPFLRTGEERDAYDIQVLSERKRIAIDASLILEGWHLLVSNDGWVVLIACICLIVAVLIAFALAQISLYPLEKLIKKYLPESTMKAESEFRQLDEILSNMDQMHSSTRTLLRNQLLNTILRGHYSERQVKRWSMLGIAFEHPHSCVFLIDAGTEAELRQQIAKQLEHTKGPQYRIYTTEIADEEKLVVIVNYHSQMTSEMLISLFKDTLQNFHLDLQIYTGIPVDSPKRLSISFMAALTESRYGTLSPRQNMMTADQLAQQLIAAAETGSASAMEAACSDATEFLSSEQAGGMLTRHHIYELVSAIIRKAEEKGIRIAKTDVNALVLLPDVNMVVNDLSKLIAESVEVGSRKSAGDDIGRLIVEYVIANAFDPDISLQDMSEEFGLSADYISSMIKKETGTAFKEYLTLLRIGEARRLLVEVPSLPIQDIAMQVGYRKASNFSKKFKELTGMLPSQAR